MAKHLAQLTTPGLFTSTWWIATLWRAAYTALATVLPLAIQVTAGTVDLTYAGSVVGVAVIGSLVTAAFSLPEITDKQLPLHKAIAHRALRTAGQVAAPALAGVVLLQDVAWSDLATTVLGAVAVTVIRTVMGAMPEVASTAPDQQS